MENAQNKSHFTIVPIPLFSHITDPQIQESFTWKPEKLCKVTYCKNRLSTIILSSVQSSGEKVIWFLCLPVMHYLLYLIWSEVMSTCPCRASFMGQKRWKLSDAKAHEYGRWGVISNFKIGICYMVRYTVWGWALLRCRQTPADNNKPRHFLGIAALSWFKSISLHNFPVFIWMTFVKPSVL